jgi:hypothetical protein
VDAVRAVVGGDPVVAGKPAPALFEETARRVGAQRPLVVGDRLDTDIAGARSFGADSLLVLTGVTDLAMLVGAPKCLRPSYVGWDLGSLAKTMDPPQVGAGHVRVHRWSASVGPAGQVRLEGGGDRDDALRAVVTLGWQRLDSEGQPVDVSDVVARLAPGSLPR